MNICLPLESVGHHLSVHPNRLPLPLFVKNMDINVEEDFNLDVEEHTIEATIEDGNGVCQPQVHTGYAGDAKPEAVFTFAFCLLDARIVYFLLRAHSSTTHSIIPFHLSVRANIHTHTHTTHNTHTHKHRRSRRIL
jgi:hypothetical protein